MDDEYEMTDYAFAQQKAKACTHKIIERIVDDYTADARKIKKKITTCERCSLYNVEIIETEEVNDEIIRGV